MTTGAHVSPHEATVASTGHEELTDDELIQAWCAADETMAMVRDGKARLELELRHRMQDREASIIEHPLLLECAIKPDNTYDQDVLDDLQGLLSEAELPQYYEPPGFKPVPRKWIINKVKPLRKRGGEIRRIIDEAVIPNERFIIKRRTEEIDG